jgi:hypothetical protein
MASKPKWATVELDDPTLKNWLQQLKLKDPYLMQGLLGVQPKNQFVTGYFVLFKDRLDFWRSQFEEK